MAEPVLGAPGVTKHSGHVLALDGAGFSAFPGEVRGKPVPENIATPLIAITPQNMNSASVKPCV